MFRLLPNGTALRSQKSLEMWNRSYSAWIGKLCKVGTVSSYSTNYVMLMLFRISQTSNDIKKTVCIHGASRTFLQWSMSSKALPQIGQPSHCRDHFIGDSCSIWHERRVWKGMETRWIFQCWKSSLGLEDKARSKHLKTQTWASCHRSISVDVSEHSQNVIAKRVNVWTTISKWVQYSFTAGSHRKMQRIES